MIKTPQGVQKVYLILILGNSLAASFIFGINTIFLLSAGLTNFEAFLANAFFTAGQVLFEVPTGIVADTAGRRVSYLLGTLTLAVSTLIYLWMWQIQGPFWGWAFSSVLLGVGFTFFSGALEAWLVDALIATNYRGNLESVFSKGQMVNGIAMFTGSVSGGVIAQFTNLGVPYILRAVILLISFVTAFIYMKDLGFTPKSGKHPIREMKKLLTYSIEHGLKKPSISGLMLAAPFSLGVGIYIFYALQPYLLELYGDEKAYTVAGLVAALVSVAQIVGGFLAPYIRMFFKRRTSALLLGIILTGVILLLVGLIQNFWVAIVLIFIWGLLFAAMSPIRQAYLNGEINSEHRATVLSFDNLMASSGGIVIQPVLGKAADMWSYSTSFVMASVIQILAIPFILRSRKHLAPSDRIEK